MTMPAIDHGYPLEWPPGRARTLAEHRKVALFRYDSRRMTMTTARRRLVEEVNRMTRPGKPWRVTDMILSTNIRFTLSGTRDQSVSRREPQDPGVAFYFTLDGRAHVLACDRWDTVYDNIAAIAAHIDALRGQERWGVADLAQAFAGHVRLAAPDPWWVVLGIDRTADRQAIDQAFRRHAKSAHPDQGGQRVEWDRLQAAYDAAKAVST